RRGRARRTLRPQSTAAALLLLPLLAALVLVDLGLDRIDAGSDLLEVGIVLRLAGGLVDVVRGLGGFARRVERLLAAGLASHVEQGKRQIVLGRRQSRRVLVHRIGIERQAIMVDRLGKAVYALLILAEAAQGVGEIVLGPRPIGRRLLAGEHLQRLAERVRR